MAEEETIHKAYDWIIKNPPTVHTISSYHAAFSRDFPIEIDKFNGIVRDCNYTMYAKYWAHKKVLDAAQEWIEANPPETKDYYYTYASKYKYPLCEEVFNIMLIRSGYVLKGDVWIIADQKVNQKIDDVNSEARSDAYGSDSN
jgi:hypothetical protein